MKKTLQKHIFAILAGFWVSLAHSAEPKLLEKTICPEWTPSEISNTWQLENPGLACRSVCNTTQDCTSTVDICGRAIVFNKSYTAEISRFLKQNSALQCVSRLDLGKDLKLDCKNKKCEFDFNNCEQDKKKFNEYISTKLATKCAKDSDCTFFLAPEESCIRRIPVTSSGEFQAHQLNISFLRDAVLRSCKITKAKECDDSEKAFCVASQCLVLGEKPMFKNFLNFEGPRYLPNYKSNTTPLKMPGSNQSKCSSDAECSEIMGVCDQYAVSLNKKFISIFKKELETTTKSIACAPAPKIQIPKSRCFKKFCSFVN